MKKYNLSSIIFKKMLILSTVFLFTFSLNAQDWQEVAAFQPAQSVYSIKFANELVGYTASAINNGTTFNIHKTIDGGNTWTEQSSGHTDFTFKDIFVFSEDNVMMCGNDGVVIHTTDGGENWTSTTVAAGGQRLNAISFVGDTGYVGGENGVIYKTENMGESWTPIPSPTPWVIHDIYFTSANKGFIGLGGDAIYYTQDGGQTWLEPITFPSPFDYWLREFSFVNENVGFVCGDGGLIFKTINGGIEWEWFDNIPHQESIQSIVALDENTIYASGYNGTVIQTLDGGENWDYMSASSNYHFYSMDFTPEGKGFIATWYGEILSYDPPLSISDIAVNTTIQVYPNPTTNLVNIQSDFIIESITVYNFAGQVILNESTDNTTYRINTSNFDTGIYLFRIETEEGSIAKRVIIE